MWGLGGTPAKLHPSSMPAHSAAPCLIPCWLRAAPRTSAFQLCLLYLESLPQMLSLEVKVLGSSQGLTVKGTHIPVPRGMSNGDVLVSHLPAAGGGREGMAGPNLMTLPFKCLLCDREPLSVTRTKEKARPPTCLCGYWRAVKWGRDCPRKPRSTSVTLSWRLPYPPGLQVRTCRNDPSTV